MERFIELILLDMLHEKNQSTALCWVYAIETFRKAVPFWKVQPFEHGKKEEAVVVNFKAGFTLFSQLFLNSVQTLCSNIFTQICYYYAHKNLTNCNKNVEISFNVFKNW